MIINRRKVRIEWGDCDPAGIVYFPRYFEIFDVCTNEMMEAAGYPKYETLKRFDLVGWSLIDVGAKFIAPSTYGDVVEIESRVSEWGRSSFKIEHRLMRGDKVAIEAFEKRVWVGKDPENPGRMRSVPIPDEVVEKFKD
jgi:4-hydroxybenzoyl-CoA thioesterase